MIIKNLPAGLGLKLSMRYMITLRNNQCSGFYKMEINFVLVIWEIKKCPIVNAKFDTVWEAKSFLIRLARNITRKTEVLSKFLLQKSFINERNLQTS